MKTNNKVSRFIISGVRFYQRHISYGRPPVCRYLPSCSQYAIEAVEEWGPLLGSLLALYRILRCNPLAKQRVDPVPKKKNKN